MCCCDHVCDLVNNYVAHTANPARRPNASAWNLQVPHLIEAQKANCKVAITLDRAIFHRNISINIIPEPQFNIMEDFTLWVPDEVISKLWKFWHAHKKEVDAWRLP